MKATRKHTQKPSKDLSSSSEKSSPTKETDSQILVEDGSPEEPEVQLVPFTKMFRFSQGHEVFLNIIGVIAAIAAGSSMPMMTFVFGRLVNNFVDFGSKTSRADAGDLDAAARVPAAAQTFRDAASLNASYMFYMGLGLFACTFTFMYIWVYTGEISAKRLREQYLQSVLRQDIPFFDKIGAGEVTTRIQTDCHMVQLGISEKVPLCVSFVAQFIAGFLVAYIKCWRLALAVSAIFPGIVIIMGLFNRFKTKYAQLTLHHVAESATLAQEVFSTVRTAQAFGSQKALGSLFNNHASAALSSDTLGAIWQGFGMGAFFFIVYSTYALSFSFGTTLINGGYADAGTVITVFMAILFGSMSMAFLAPEMQVLMAGRAAAAKLFATIDRIPDIDSSSPDGHKPEQVMGEIVMDKVSFNYPSRPDVSVLDELSLRFPPGKAAALVGASGCGKSTIVSLVERFYDPLSGSITFDGHDIKELNLTWLRSQIGLVGQEPVLFSTTIRANVENGLVNTPQEHLSDAEKMALVKEACIKANADGFISGLPQGYNTMVGERGFLMSGGQKQRIAIARAIISNPKILLLDEATSALDTQSEGIVQDALDRAAKGRTTITIAHRLSTIKNADIIYVLSQGALVEQGSHHELLQKPDGAYAQLVKAQELRVAQEEHVEDLPEKALTDAKTFARRGSLRSMDSSAAEKQDIEMQSNSEDVYSLFYIGKRMAEINKDQKLQYIIAFIAAGLTGLSQPAIGLVFAKGVEGFSDPDPHQRRFFGDRNALWFFIICVTVGMSMGCSNFFFTAAASQLSYKLRIKSFNAVLRQDIEYFDRDENNSGSLAVKLNDNPQHIYGLSGISLGAIVQSVITLIGGLVLGLIFVWKVALVTLACTPLLASGGYIRLRVVVLKDQANKKAHHESAQLACEAAGSIRTVASLTRENDCVRLYSQSLEKPLRRSNKAALWSNLLYAVSQALFYFVFALIFWYGSRLVSTREYSTFQFFVSLMAGAFSAVQAGNAFNFVPDMSKAKGAGSDIINLLDSVPEIDSESPDGKRITTSEGHLRLENLHFRYPNRPTVPVLRGLNLTIEPGSYVALVGGSGCGKSTIIQLLERFYNPTAGDIYLDHQRISDINVQDYRSQISLVSQEPTLYAGTIRFNVLLGATKSTSDVSQKEIEAACRDANILDFITSLPDGFETQVGGKGSQLSGGQKQRIAIARALIRNPKVLLLDEATSALDSDSEKVVQTALDQAAKGRTTIAIAHRLSTIQNADQIYFVQDGHIVEAGTHNQLLAKRGAYSEYVTLQNIHRA